MRLNRDEEDKEL